MDHRRYGEEKKCKVCGKVFKPRYNAFNQVEKYCSNECFKVGRSQTTNYHIKAKLNSDPSFKFHQLFRSVVTRTIRGNNQWSESTWIDRIGYNLEQLKGCIQDKWIDGMTWDNYGDWNIDHIVPTSFFRCTDYSNTFKACWSLENIQPLWLEDNTIKSNILEISALHKVPLVLSMRTGTLQIYYQHQGQLIKLNHGNNIDKKFYEIAKRAFSEKKLV